MAREQIIVRLMCTEMIYYKTHTVQLKRKRMYPFSGIILYKVTIL